MRTAINFVLRAYAYLFHLVLALFLIGISLVAGASGKPLELGMLPWQGNQLNKACLGLGICGVVLVLLSVMSRIRYVFPLWALFILILMARGFFLSSYPFAGEAAFRGAVWLTVGALGAFLSSLCVYSRRTRRR